MSTESGNGLVEFLRCEGPRFRSTAVLGQESAVQISFESLHRFIIHDQNGITVSISSKYFHSSPGGPGGTLLRPIRRLFGSLGGLLKRRVPVVASLKDSLSSKDNLIATRTKIIVGAMP